MLITGCVSEMSKGSAKNLYTIADILQVNRADLGKDIQLKLDQKLFFNFEPDPEHLGDWELVQYDNRHLLMLNDHPYVESGNWGLLLQARALGFSEVELRFTPVDENEKPQNYIFSISISR
jgi:hypothetical protein